MGPETSLLPLTSPHPIGRILFAALWMLPLAGCPWLDSLPAGGNIEGKVLFNGRGAPGKIVTLLVARNNAFESAKTADGQPLSTATDASGIYRFKGLADGIYKATYQSQSVPDGNKVPRAPNEIGSWRTRAREVSASAGVRMPEFDVAYNGLIYPSTGIAYIVSDALPLPFHWSTHLQGQKYKLAVYNNRSGKPPSINPTSEWTNQPTSLFKQPLNSGIYSWEVNIDAGDAGEGISLVREVDMGPPPTNPAEPGTGE